MAIAVVKDVDIDPREYDRRPRHGPVFPYDLALSDRQPAGGEEETGGVAPIFAEMAESPDVHGPVLLQTDGDPDPGKCDVTGDDGARPEAVQQIDRDVDLGRSQCGLAGAVFPEGDIPQNDGGPPTPPARAQLANLDGLSEALRGEDGQFGPEL